VQVRLGRTPGEGEALFPDRDFVKDFVMCGYAGLQEDARGRGDGGVQWVLVGDTIQAKDKALEVTSTLPFPLPLFLHFSSKSFFFPLHARYITWKYFPVSQN
jgi:hypothetical protein